MAASLFTLSWTHSAQKTEWQEDWQITSDGLTLSQARVKGSGAGMEPPQGARLVDGWWVYKPGIKPQKRVILASSGLTGSGWRLCAAGACQDFEDTGGAPITLSACAP